MRQASFVLTSLLLVCVACVACGGQSFSDSGDASAGGIKATGGNSAAGGASTTGGNITLGGMPATGGLPAAGGVATTGGTKAMGGSPSTGGANGSGGAKATGGNRSTGGAIATGGAKTGGGSPATGGANGSGGAKATGGNRSTGGAIATGGAAAGGGSPATGGTSAGIPCGPSICLAGQHCCDASCGMCSNGNVCPAIACASGGNTSTGGAPATGGATATGGSSGVTACDANCTNAGFTCCDITCRNVSNDPYNCGQCGNICPSNAPICQNGQCNALLCTAELGPPGTVCCGQAWCNVGQLCCEVQGPVSTGPACLTTTDGTCPRGCKLCVCANPDTPIATPDGPRNISELRVGDLVYSVDHDQVVPVPIVAVKQRPALSHIVPQILLDNGQVLQISARHPTADKRTFGDLKAGDKLGELRIKAVEMVTYEHAFTYDILPASDTGFYFAGGALIGSTLMPNSDRLICELASEP